MILGVGIDLADARRIEAQVREQGDAFLESFLCPAEIAYGLGKRWPFPHHAARFAAKEAFAKAMGTGIGKDVSWLDLEVRLDDAGRPELHLEGAALAAARRLGVGRIHVSLTHEGDVAAAVVVLERRDS